jgi:hypothetical protein
LLLSIIIFPTLPQPQVMAPEAHQPGAIGSESSQTAGISTNVPSGVTQQQRGHQLVHRNAAIVDTKNLTQEAHLETVRKAGSRKNQMQQAMGCK